MKEISISHRAFIPTFLDLIKVKYGCVNLICPFCAKSFDHKMTTSCNKRFFKNKKRELVKRLYLITILSLFSIRIDFTLNYCLQFVLFADK